MRRQQKYNQRFCTKQNPTRHIHENLWKDTKNMLTCLMTGPRVGIGQCKGKSTFDILFFQYFGIYFIKINC